MIELRRPVRRWLGDNVQIVYLDDSKQEKNKQRFQLIGAVIVNDVVFNELEQHLAYYLYELVEPDVGGKIEEFHSSDILAGNKPFEKVSRERALQILSTAIAAVDQFHMLKLHEQVSQPYMDAVAPTINEQIAKAGARLAMVLNQIWP